MPVAVVMVSKRDITGQLLCANRYGSPEVVSASSFAAHAVGVYCCYL